MSIDLNGNPFPFKPDNRTDRGMTNGDRAMAAVIAVNTLYSGMSREPIETDIQDLISDLFHLCDREGIDVEAMLSSARARWEEER